MFIAAERRVPRTAAALGGAAVMSALGLIDAPAALVSQDTGIDWNAIFLLVDMMIIVSVMRETGIFE